MPQASKVRRILIQWDVKGRKVAEDTAKKLDRISKSAKKTAGSMSQLRSAFAGYLGLQGVRILSQWSDSLQLLRDRMSIFTGSTEAATEALFDLQGAAAFTKSSITGLAESYNRIALATKDLGLSSDAVLATTIALQQTFRLSGSTLAEATASTIQLTQGLAAGALRGQELRSVLEANALFGGLLAKEFKVTRGELIKLGETGKITSDKVLKILADNFEDLNASAAKLGQTFEQTTTIALDKVRMKVFQLNEAFGISGGFAKALDVASENTDVLVSALIALATLALPAVITGIRTLTAAMAANPIGLALVAITFSISELVQNTGKWFLRLQKFWIEAFVIPANVAAVAMTDFYNVFIRGVNAVFAIGGRGDLYDLFDTQGLKNNISIATKEFGALQKGMEAIDQAKKDAFTNFKIQRFVDALKNTKLTAQGLGEKFGALAEANKAFGAGLITWTDYMDEKSVVAMQKLNKEVRLGKISIDKYYDSVTKLEGKFDVNSTLYTGINNYISQAGTLSSNIAGAITKTFGHLEDTIVEFVKTGKFAFKDFTKAVLDDLTRIIIRASIIKPLASGLLGAIPTGGVTQTGTTTSSLGSGTGGQLVSAQGNAFSGGAVQAFAQGGLVSQPTLFSHSGGTGLMGEAGTEAIMPLQRTSGGDLGVKANMAANVQVNVINQAGADTQVSERKGNNGEQILDILVTKKVIEGIGSGKFDSSMNRAYGVRRKGA